MPLARIHGDLHPNSGNCRPIVAIPGSPLFLDHDRNITLSYLPPAGRWITHDQPLRVGWDGMSHLSLGRLNNNRMLQIGNARGTYTTALGLFPIGNNAEQFLRNA